MSSTVKLFFFGVLTLIYVSLTFGAIHTNHYAVHIEGGKLEADRLATKYGYINKGQIGSLQDHYLFLHRGVHKRSLRPNFGKHTYLSKESKVHWLEQQVAKTRVKRNIKFTDPDWQKQWYLNRDDFNMNVMEAWELGYTGKGVVVTILDDGIERDHPDLVDNYDPEASVDINNGDNDPMPRPTWNDENRHGTRCAGEVAMKANSSLCGVGVAYNSKIGGIRMLDGMVTDAVEAQSLSHEPQHVDIYSASWGPDDDGKTVDGPGRLARKSFEDGVSTGRKGRGSIFVWASGNGGSAYDSCNWDGYHDSIYTISISSASEGGKIPWYAELCASTLASTYSSGGRNDRQINTVDLRHKCTDRHTGTSASAPLAAGILALVLEANPELTWRDIQHIIVRTSRRSNLQIMRDNRPKRNKDVDDDRWITNGAGYQVSHAYGFGLLDAGAMVKLAKGWKTAPKQHVCVLPTESTPRLISGKAPVRISISSDGCLGSGSAIQYIEHVQVKLTVDFTRRGDLAVFLTSPAGTRSTLLAPRQMDRTRETVKDWVTMTTHCWGEPADGTWTLEVQNRGPSSNAGTLHEWTLTVYGTDSPVNPGPSPAVASASPAVVKVERNVNATKHPQTRAQGFDDDFVSDDYSDYYYSADDCDEECLDGCDGSNPEDCWTCRNFRDRLTLKCVSMCPDGFYAPDVHHRCRYCDEKCGTCNGPSEYDCLSCPDGQFLIEDRSQCTDDCGVGYFLEYETQNCVPCESHCKQCLGSADFCISCQDGMEMQGSTCLIGCPMHTYKDIDDKCQQCDESCYSCTGPSDEECLDCQQGYILQERKCLRGDSCGESYYRNTYVDPPECAECHETCKTCIGPGEDDCLECAESLHFNDGRCQQTCAYGEYMGTDNECKACDEFCVQCQGQGQCYECEYGKFLDDEATCVQECRNGKYGYNGECHTCHSSCKKCQGSGAADCIQCKRDEDDRRFLQEGMCVSHCSTGYYGDEDANVCRSCDPSCLSCDGPSSRDCLECAENDPVEGECAGTDESDCDYVCKTCNPRHPEKCTSCFNGKYLSEDDCVESELCPSGTFGDDASNECLNCHPTCETCNDKHHTSCITCETNYYLTDDSTCESECPIGTYTDNKAQECTECHSSCESCVGAGHERCTSCVPGKYLNGNNCVIYCDDNQYRDEDSKLCIPCHRSCATCSGPSDYDCTSCPDGFDEYHGACTSKCRDGQYQADGDCVFCNDACETCNGGSESECLSCKFGQFLAPDSTCTSQCDNRFFEDYSSGTCQSCHSTCERCLGSAETDCWECIDGLYLYEGVRCVEHCPEGFYAETSNKFSECQPCSLGCLDCVDKRDKCISCRDYTYLFINDDEDDDEQRCVDVCPKGYTADEYSQQCIKIENDCPLYCARCNSFSECEECEDGFVLRYDLCYSDDEACEYNEYDIWDDNGGMTCQPCHESCNSCVGPSLTDCTSCTENTILQGGKCLTTCVSGEYADDRTQQCESCHASCWECNGPSATDCLACRTPYHYDTYLGTCRSQCPTGNYESSVDECSPCHDDCGSCDGPTENECLSCKNPYFHYEYACLDTCPDGYYGDNVLDSDGQDVKECRRCHYKCKTCYGPMSDHCIECDEHLVMMGNDCVSVCGAGFHEVKGDCKPCHYSCEQCKGPGDDECLSCPAGAVLQEYSCKSRCEESHYIDADNTTCSSCHPSCQECRGPGPQDCTKCTHNDWLQDQICYPRCLPGHYFNGHENDSIENSAEKCEPCDSSCKACLGPGPKQCLACDKPRVYDKRGHRCVTCCDPNSVENSDEECCNCDSKTGECKTIRSSGHNTALNSKVNVTKVSTLVGAIVGSIVGVFLIVFGVLQCRSKRLMCFSRNYQKLPTYYESNTDEVRMPKQDYGEEDVEIYSQDRL
ncbi:proprotein convertase subtilisin/kexin type 5-like isoform X2 [Glandiceps talaboti]